jgi:hypothetical protein
MGCTTQNIRTYCTGPPYNCTVKTTLFDEIWRWEMSMDWLHGGLAHLPPRVYINGDKRTIELYVVINHFGRFLLTNSSTNIPGRTYVAICTWCTFIYTRTSCSMDWNFPGASMLEHAGHKSRSNQTRNLYEEILLLRYDAEWLLQEPTFRRNITPPSLG